MQQRQQMLREHERRGHVHVHDAHEGRDVVLLDGRERAQQGRVVQQAVEPAITLLDGGGHGFVVRRQRALQVERHDAGLGCTELSAISACTASSLRTVRPEQDHFGAGRRQRQRHGAADAGTRAGDHDDAAVEFTRRRIHDWRGSKSFAHQFWVSSCRRSRRTGVCWFTRGQCARAARWDRLKAGLRR